MLRRLHTGWNPLAVIAALIGVVMTGVYIGLISQEDDRPVAWFLGGLVAASALAIYGAAEAAPLRTAALLVSGAALAVLGFLAIFSIGLPILVAAALTLVAAGRSFGKTLG